MKFKATATAEDITGDVKNGDHFCYAEENKLAGRKENCVLTIKRNNVNSLRLTPIHLSVPCTGSLFCNHEGRTTEYSWAMRLTR
ncbi:hypothetical protein FQN60_004528 [Etheostoma spectabile]|uniref:Uncharacterized protein n=1 Tax=Etheostoma spectabile TaxID=54343 RepID=A0A5J5DK28_9PERO|nr:hypothetical protein FQN60_004528 [Etheostoma spectabile]